MTTEEELALASLAFAGIKQIYNIVEAAKSGSMSASAALAHVQTMLDGLPSAFAANDAAADAVVAKRFPK